MNAMPAPCSYCGKDCQNDYNKKKHEKVCYKRPKEVAVAVRPPTAGTAVSTPAAPAYSSAWPTYRAPSATPTQAVNVPTGAGGRVVSSGLWKTLASLENAFLTRGRVICTDEQDAAMDQNLQAIMGKSGQPVSPWAGFLVGLLGIFVVPLVVEFAPMVKKAAADWWEKNSKKKEEPKHDNRSQPPVAGPQPVG